MELVAASARDDQLTHAAGGDVGAGAARLIDDLFIMLCVRIGLRGAVATHAVQLNPVEQHHGLFRAHAVHRLRVLVHGAGPADVGRTDDDARHERAHGLRGFPGRQRIEQIAVDHLRFGGALDVYDRRRAAHDHRLFKAADAKLRVDGGREVARHVDVASLDGGETGERESHAITARRKVDDLVQALAIGDRGAGAFDEGRTTDFDGDARHHRAR